MMSPNPANTRHSPNAISMLGQRRGRWANIETALGECLVFAGKLKVKKRNLSFYPTNETEAQAQVDFWGGRAAADGHRPS